MLRNLILMCVAFSGSIALGQSQIDTNQPSQSMDSGLANQPATTSPFSSPQTTSPPYDFSFSSPSTVPSTAPSTVPNSPLLSQDPMASGTGMTTQGGGTMGTTSRAPASSAPATSAPTTAPTNSGAAPMSGGTTR